MNYRKILTVASLLLLAVGLVSAQQSTTLKIDSKSLVGPSHTIYFNGWSSGAHNSQTHEVALVLDKDYYLYVDVNLPHHNPNPWESACLMVRMR
ncbi:MAG: hypothetical protein LR015_01040 [Verrucomicrobia bacterium]|nr:hypothetical protein [Verrucomicrobiota bacterium]